MNEFMTHVVRVMCFPQPVHASSRCLSQGALIAHVPSVSPHSEVSVAEHGASLEEVLDERLWKQGIEALSCPGLCVPNCTP